MFSRPAYDKKTTDSLGRKGVLAFLSRLAPGLATLVVNIGIGRLGGSTLLGLTQTIMSGASIAALAYPAGSAASRYVSSLRAKNDSEEAEAVASYLSVRVLIASIAAAVLVSAIVLRGEHGTIAVVILSGLMVLAVAWRAFAEGLHFGGGESERLARWSLSIALLSAASTLSLLVVGVRDVWVLAPLVLLNLAFATLSWPRKTRRRVERGLAREIRGFIVLSVVGTVASTGFGQVAVLVAGLTQGLAFVGQYAAAMTMTTPLGVIASALGAVLFPALAATHRSGARETVKQRLADATSAVVTIMVGLFIPLAVASELLVKILWGPKFTLTAWIMLYVLPAVVVSTIAVPAVSAVTASSNRGMATSAVSSVVGAIAGVGVWLVMIPAGNEFAVPLGFAVGTTVIAAIPFAIAWRRYQMHWFGEAALAVAAISITLAFVVLANQWWDSNTWSLFIGCLGLTLGWFCLRYRSVRVIVDRLKRRR